MSRMRRFTKGVERRGKRKTRAGGPSTTFGTSQRYVCRSADGAALPSRLRVKRRAPSRLRSEFVFVSHSSATTLANSVRTHIATLGRERYRTRTSCTKLLRRCKCSTATFSARRCIRGGACSSQTVHGICHQELFFGSPSPKMNVLSCALRVYRGRECTTEQTVVGEA